MVRIEVEGAAATARMLRGVAPRVMTSIEQRINAVSLRLLSRVKNDKLSGQVLKNRSGRLRGSITQEITERTDARIVAEVGTNKEYARPHEYGGKWEVPAHQRMQRLAWGKPMKNPRLVDVKKHDVVLPERSFLRSALREMAPEIRAEIAKAVEEGVRR